MGNRGSHGCIRLTVADAQWIYENAKAGMKVWIHDDAKADPELKAVVKPGALNEKTMMPYITPPPPEEYWYENTIVPEQARNGGMTKKNVGEAVYWLQMALRELGYYEGAPTGQMLDGTMKALWNYQKAKGFSTSDTVEKQVVDAIARDLRVLHATPAPQLLYTLAPATETPAP